MVALWVSQGAAVQLGAIGPMILGRYHRICRWLPLTASTSVAVYAMIVGLAAPTWGIYGAAVGAWLLCLVFVAIPCVLLLRHMARGRAARDSVCTARESIV